MDIEEVKEKAKKPVRDINELRDLLKQFGDENTRDYELCATYMAVAHQYEPFEMWLDQLMEPSNHEEDKVVFAAFVVRVIRLRRLLKKDEEGILLESQRERYGNRLLYKHLYVIYLSQQDKIRDITELLELAKKDSEELHHAGAQHMFAIAVADIFELKEESEEITIPEENWLEEGLQAVKLAIKENPYSKFFSTKGRLLSLAGRHEEGIQEINKAIEVEPKSNADYKLRIAEYEEQIRRIKERQKKENEAPEEKFRKIVENKDKLYQRLKEAGDVTTRQYELNLTAMATSEQKAKFESWLDELIEVQDEEASHEDKEVSFSAFVVRVLRLRRMRNHSEEGNLLQKYKEKYGQKAFYKHLYIIHLLGEDHIQDPKEILNLAKDDAINLPHAGAQHVFACAVADILETLEYSEKEVPEGNWVEEALKAVNWAINEDPFPRFYVTRGRLLSLSGDHEKGVTDIDKGIDMESPKNTDYALRIAEFRIYRQRIRDRQMKAKLQHQIDELQNSEELRKKQEEEHVQKLVERLNAEDSSKFKEEVEATIRSKINHSIIKNIEVLAIFAAVMSFSIGAINTASNMGAENPLGAAMLIVTLASALLIIITGLSLLLHDSDDKRNLNSDSDSDSDSDSKRKSKILSFLSKTRRKSFLFSLGLAGIIVSMYFIFEFC